MRFGVSGNYQKSLLRSGAILAALVAAGCSSDVSRFQDSILTGSSRQPQMAPVSQPFPGDSAGLDNTYTGSVGQVTRTDNVSQRNAGRPVPMANVGGAGQAYPQTQMASAPVQNYPQPSYPTQPQMAAAPADVSRGALAPIASAPVQSATLAQPQGQLAPGESSLGQLTVASSPAASSSGSTVTVAAGDTISAIAARHGVSVADMIQANNIADASSLRVGQQLVIPGRAGAVQVAAVQPGTGGQQPTPAQAPERVAVVPTQPQPAAGNGATVAAGSPASSPAAGGQTYTVAAGDTLNAIASRNGVSATALREANGLSSGLIRVGQTLVIPAGGNGGTTQVAAATPAPARVDPAPTGSTQPSEPAPVTAYTPPTGSSSGQSGGSGTSVAEASQQVAAIAPNSTGITSMRWPVRGRVISSFGQNQSGRPNDGIDIAVPEGTPIKASENGVVIFAGPGLKDFGNTVLVRHDNGLVTVYGHASEIKVARGDTVRRGQDIALSGRSGAAETPKLHFEVRKDSAPVNPANYLE